MTEETPVALQWHERTVKRSLRNARERAITRGDRYIKAASDLLRATGKSDFTVQEVVDRCGMSLRSFYDHFATKDDLLLALIEESVRRYIGDLRPRVDATEGALAKLELVLTAALGDRDGHDPASRGMILFHWHLAASRTDEFVATLSPQVEIISEIIEQGGAEGIFRTDIPVSVQASLVNQTLLSLLDMRVLGVDLTPETITAEHLVAWCLTAIGTQPPPAPGPASRRGPPVVDAGDEGGVPAA